MDDGSTPGEGEMIRRKGMDFYEKLCIAGISEMKLLRSRKPQSSTNYFSSSDLHEKPRVRKVS